MWSTIKSVVRFLLTATRGTRLRPWRSPYLRWRMETYTGKPAGSLGWKDFLTLAIAERRQLARFARWTGEMARLSERNEPE